MNSEQVAQVRRDLVYIMRLAAIRKQDEGHVSVLVLYVVLVTCYNVILFVIN